jgi:hypothetical protein
MEHIERVTTVMTGSITRWFVLTDHRNSVWFFGGGHDQEKLSVGSALGCWVTEVLGLVVHIPSGCVAKINIRDCDRDRDPLPLLPRIERMVTRTQFDFDHQVPLRISKKKAQTDTHVSFWAYVWVFIYVYVFIFL